MNYKQGQLFFSILTLAVALSLVPATHATSYDLKSVKGIQAFSGSDEAKALLTKNGFVVADPTFKQIFQAYIESPEIEQPSETNHWGVTLPSFITPDSAWDTYHILLEEGVKEMEIVQAQTLLKFSQQLLSAARQQHADRDLLLFASVGLALQDEQHHQSLSPDEKRIVDAVRNGSSDIPVPVPIGFDLSPVQFRPQSFYTQSPQLSDYFAARQWYASVVFRLVNPRETRLAVALARLVNGNPQLLALLKQLSEPFDNFLATAEDGTVRQYADAVASVLPGAAMDISDAQLAEIQKKLESTLPLPRVNDQMMTPEQFLQFAKQSRGFRLLPPRRLPCATCFQDTVYPKIPNRYYPSGLDFMAASPVLRSPASVRALQGEFGKSVSDLILKTDCGPMPDSLHGQAMQLLAKLQQPLPSDVAAPLRTEAWHDLQLWTQLGAWAEQRHTWALHTKMNADVAGIVTPPKGMVAPYPDFFAGLATLTRKTAEAFQQAGMNQQFDVKSAADKLLDIFRSRKNSSRVINLDDVSPETEQFGRFEGRYYELHHSELEKNNARDAYKQMEDDLEALAQRGSTGQASVADIEALRLFYDCRQDTARLLNDFAPVCDRLAELAKKSLHNEPLSDDDAKWIEGYGITLAGFHFYYGNSYEVPEDNSPIVTRVFYDPVGGKMFYAGLARPQALYIIIPNGKSLQLYRGAVMTYREFVHPDKELLDDDGWRAMVAKGSVPPAPPFTKSFYAEKSAAELLKQLLGHKRNEESEEEDDQNPDDILWQLGARATEKDLPQLLEGFTRAEGQQYSGIAEGLSEIIARLSWKSHEQQLMNILASPDYILANAAAHIFIQQPASIDSDNFVALFAKQPVRARRFYCVIISAMSQQTPATKQMLLQALHDRRDGVRWQAALAIGKAGWNDQSSRNALLGTLNDTNELVAAAAVHALLKLGATDAAPKLLEKLKIQASLPVRVSEERSPQVEAILADFQHGQTQPSSSFLDVDGLEWRIERGVTRIMQQRANFRGPPLPIEMAMHNYCLADELIEALGELKYEPAIEELMKLRGTPFDAEAARSLDQLDPDRLADGYLKTALDKQADSYVREQALLALSKTSATNRVRELIPLLDDTTVINYSRPMPPGMEIKICDRAAETIAVMLGWEDRRMRRPFVPPKQREELMSRVRDWAGDNAANK